MSSEQPLRHRYFILRHGHSIPNGKKLIVSSMDEGVKPEYGLTARGRDQALAAGRDIAARVGDLRSAPGFSDAPVMFLVSPFSRAQETAKLACSELSRAGERRVSFATEKRLRERFFGALELQPDTNYPKVWAEDEARRGSSSFGAEAVEDVWSRVRNVVTETEARYPGARCLVFLVAHGDTLQITQTAMAARPLHSHRSLKHLNQAEWREVTPAGGRLPVPAPRARL